MDTERIRVDVTVTLPGGGTVELHRTDLDGEEVGELLSLLVQLGWTVAGAPIVHTYRPAGAS